VRLFTPTRSRAPYAVYPAAEAGASTQLPDVAINVRVREQRGDKSHALGSLTNSTIRSKTALRRSSIMYGKTLGEWRRGVRS